MQARRRPPPVTTQAARPRGRTILLGAGLLAGAAMAALAYLGVAGHFNGWSYLTDPLRTDFAKSYWFARIGLEFQWSHVYDLAATHRVAQEMGLHSSDPDIPHLYPPPVGWLVAPFALLPLPVAYALWAGGELACLGFAWRVTARGRLSVQLLQLGVAAAFIPLVFAICLGQVVLLIMAALSAGWWLLRRGAEVPAGVALAFLVLKPQIAILVPLALLMAGRRRAFAAFAGTCGLILGAMLLILPLPVLWAYGTRLTQTGLHPADFLVYSDLTTAAVSPWPLALALQLATALAVLGTAYLVRHEAVRDELAIAAGLVGSLLIVPYLHYQDLAVLVLAGWLLVRTTPAPWQWYGLVFGFLAANSEIFFWAGLTRLAELGWLAGMLAVALAGSRTRRVRMAVHADP